MPQTYPLALSQNGLAHFADAGRRQAVVARMLGTAPHVRPDDRTVYYLQATPQHRYAHLLEVNGAPFPSARIQSSDLVARLGRALGFQGLPHKGGIRAHETVTLGKLDELSGEMDIKLAITAPLKFARLHRAGHGGESALRKDEILFMGGGKGGICVNPRLLSEYDRFGLIAEFGRNYALHLVGPERDLIDVPAPDVNTDGLWMRILNHEFNRQADRIQWSAYTGKRIEDGGLFGRDEATARGACVALEWYLRQKFGEGDHFVDKKVIIHGLGNAGGHTARIMAERGAHVVAFSDSQGVVKAENERGYFTLEEILAFLKLKDTEKGTGAKLFERNYSSVPENIVEIEADILFLAAVNLTLTSKNADEVKARIVVEEGNGMTDDDADQILQGRGIVVIPDVWANSGGVIDSGYEYLQGLEWKALSAGARRVYWTGERTLRLMSAQIIAAGEAIYGLAEEHHLSVRAAADAYALHVFDMAFRHVELGQSLADVA